MTTIASVLFLISGCWTDGYRQSLIEESLSVASSNATEISRVLSHYEDNDPRKEVAEYLIASMLGNQSISGVGIDSVELLYREGPKVAPAWFDSLQLARGKHYASLPRQSTTDLKELTATYLVENIEDAWQSYTSHNWNEGLTINDFCELILPYKRGNEAVSSWRRVYKDSLNRIADKVDSCQSSVEAARIVASFIAPTPYNDQLSMPHRTAIDLLEAPYGFCRDDCDRTLYAMRSFGIPVTVDMSPVSPDYNGLSHQWCVVYDNNDRMFRMFDNGRYLPTRDSIHYDGRRKGKIFRQRVLPDYNRGASLPHDAPEHLRDPRLVDVTASYFGHNEISVPTEANYSEVVYLGVYTYKNGFKAIDIGKNTWYGHTIFTDIEPDLIYFPIILHNRKAKVCGMPFMATKDGSIHSFIPDTTKIEHITLTRKMPIRFHQHEWFSRFKDFRIECGQSPEGPWRVIHTINELPTSNYHKIILPEKVTDRYIRIVDLNKPYLAEVTAYSDILLENKLQLSIVGDNKTQKRQAAIVDGDILSWYACIDGENGVVLRIDSQLPLQAIYVSPRNDDNYVVAGQRYELLYFYDGVWKSVAQKTSKSSVIDFDVPANSVMLLKNLSRGQEEQIFIWKNERQYFNLDLMN